MAYSAPSFAWRTSTSTPKSMMMMMMMIMVVEEAAMAVEASPSAAVLVSLRSRSAAEESAAQRTIWAELSPILIVTRDDSSEVWNVQ